MKSNPPTGCCEKCKPTDMEDVNYPGWRFLIKDPICVHDTCPCHKREDLKHDFGCCSGYLEGCFCICHQRECCEKCACKGHPRDEMGNSVGHDGNCHNKACPCHTPQQEKTGAFTITDEGKVKFLGKIVPTTERDIAHAKKLAEEHRKTEQENFQEDWDRTIAAIGTEEADASWEERLETLLREIGAVVPNTGGKKTLTLEGIAPLKAFIRKVREESYEKGKIAGQLEHSDRFVQQGIEIGQKKGENWRKGYVQGYDEGVIEGRRRAVEYIKEHSLHYPQLANKVGVNLRVIKDGVLEAASRELPDNK